MFYYYSIDPLYQIIFSLRHRFRDSSSYQPRLTASSAIFTARKRSLRRLCFYRCLSVHTGGSCMVLFRGACMVLFGGGMHGFIRGACMVFSVFSDTIRYGQWAGSTHPTGMHSCEANFCQKVAATWGFCPAAAVLFPCYSNGNFDRL